MRDPRAAVIDYSVALAVTNPASPGFGVNRATRQDGLQLITLGQTEFGADHPRAGEITLGTDAQSVSCQEYWFRGRWFDNVTIYWRDFASPGPLQNRTYDEPNRVFGTPHGTQEAAALAARLTVPAGETASARFVISWSYPNCVNYWRPRLAVPVPGAGALYARRRLPLQRGGRRRHGIPPAAAAGTRARWLSPAPLPDGQFGGVIKAYRDWSAESRRRDGRPPGGASHRRRVSEGLRPRA